MTSETMTETINKTVHVGTVPCGRKMESLFCKVQYTEGRLSITGVIGPKQNGDAAGGCGQICMEFAHANPKGDDKRHDKLVRPDEISFAPGWDAALWLKFLDVWAEWHLNDMRAGCAHQRALGWTYDEHPSEPCPVCGYKYGTSWLSEEVPQDVLAFLVGLPDADKQPAWV